jgi:hypothetical protein
MVASTSDSVSTKRGVLESVKVILTSLEGNRIET